jgi:hypothetical protein
MYRLQDMNIYLRIYEYLFRNLVRLKVLLKALTVRRILKKKKSQHFPLKSKRYLSCKNKSHYFPLKMKECVFFILYANMNTFTYIGGTIDGYSAILPIHPPSIVPP